MSGLGVVGKVHQVEYHRNGIGGEGFHAVLFDMAKDEGGGLAVGIVFEGEGQVAVLRVAPLSDPAIGITFGMNSWRGDRYEPELRAAIAGATK